MVKNLTNPFRDAPLPLGSLITAAGQRLSARLDLALAGAGFPDLRAAHAPVFMAVDAEGTRLTRVAERTKMSKQAAGELTRHLTARGYLEVSPDPTDRRAKVLRLTARGWEAIEVGQQVIAEYDAWLDETVGAESVAQVRDVLTKIIDGSPSNV
ncbi:MAG: MarR family transcriptional regulator [Propionibacteriaceae bacterium]